MRAMSTFRAFRDLYLWCFRLPLLTGLQLSERWYDPERQRSVERVGLYVNRTPNNNLPLSSEIPASYSKNDYACWCWGVRASGCDYS